MARKALRLVPGTSYLLTCIFCKCEVKDFPSPLFYLTYSTAVIYFATIACKTAGGEAMKGSMGFGWGKLNCLSRFTGGRSKCR